MKKHTDKLRFGVVGVANTVIDFLVLFSLVKIGLSTITSNIISTTVALIFSYFANKNYTFQNLNKGSARTIVYFLIITLFGLWLMQPVIIETTSPLFNKILNNNFSLIASKGLATLFSLTWNYFMYRKFVFTDNKS
ncbi:GtrA family protein [Candidatus Saccharibacteria bacterium]|nr:GtrA family protein [Candidatus Saccharibacteria bacterium]